MSAIRFGIIGAGNMGGAIIRGVLRAGLFAPDEIVVCDIVREKAEMLERELKIRYLGSAPEVARAAATLLIAVKPQTMGECLSGIRDAVAGERLVLSIAAGISTAYIEERLPKGAHVVRVMPNTPAIIGAGAAAICAGTRATEDDMAETARIFAAVGTVYTVPESLMDTVTAVSGSGPAYLFYFAECLTQAAVEHGLPPHMSADLVTQTLYGAARLLRESGEEAAALRSKVTSPGGTTEAALAVMRAGGLKKLIAAAVDSAVKRGHELGGVNTK